MLNEKGKNVIKLIEQNESSSNYFFNRVKDLKWFYPLMEHGFFLPEKIPRSESGGFLFWNVLDYLERVSEQVAENPKYGKELIDIIETIVRFARGPDTKRINNYHIWWYCVKILNNRPIHIIKDNLPIDDQTNGNQTKYGFKTWLETWTDLALVGGLTVVEISGKLLSKFLGNDATIPYAEAIIAAITRIRSVDTADIITNRKEADLVYESYWLRDTFKKYHEVIGQKCSVKTVFDVANNLKKALEYKRKEYFVHCQAGAAVYRITVSRIEDDKKRPDERSFKAHEYKCLVEQFAKE